MPRVQDPHSAVPLARPRQRRAMFRCQGLDDSGGRSPRTRVFLKDAPGFFFLLLRGNIPVGCRGEADRRLLANRRRLAAIGWRFPT